MVAIASGSGTTLSNVLPAPVGQSVDEGSSAQTSGGESSSQAIDLENLSLQRRDGFVESTETDPDLVLTYNAFGGFDATISASSSVQGSDTVDDGFAHPQFTTVPHISNTGDYGFSMAAFGVRFGGSDVSFDGIELEMAPNSMMDIWANPDGTITKNVFALDGWSAAPRYDDKLFVARVQAGDTKIDGVFVRGDLGLVESQLSFKDYTIDTFLHDLVVPDATGDWVGSAVVTAGDVLKTSQGFLYRVLSGGNLGTLEPDYPNYKEGKGVRSFASGTAQIEFVGAAQFSGAWKMARLGGMRWYFTNMAAGHLAEQAPTAVKRYLDMTIKNLVRDWASGREIKAGMRVGGANTGGMIWECIEGGVTCFNPAFLVNAPVGTVVQEAWGVKWRAVGAMHGNATWFLTDTNGEMTEAREPDSHDSYAATLVWAVQKYLEATGDYAWLQNASVHDGMSNARVLQEVISANILTQFAGNGLTKVFQNDQTPSGGVYPARFLMDNVEVWAGLNAAVSIYKSIGDIGYSNYMKAFADTNLAGIEGLWQEDAGAYKWEAGVDMAAAPELAAFYPYVSSQYWASYWGVPLQHDRLIRAAQFADEHFRDWQVRTDADDFASLGVHYGRYMQGKTLDLHDVLDVARRRHLRGNADGEILPMEFIASDGAMYLLMKELPTSVAGQFGGLGLENMEPGARVQNGPASGPLGAEQARALVNSGNGNFVYQEHDGWLASTGLDIDITRTYNSQATAGSPGMGNWQIGVNRSVQLDSLTGFAYRSNGDGSVSKFILSDGVYWSEDGQGAFDKLVFDAGQQRWTFTDGATGVIEVYDAAKGGRIVSSQDASGNLSTFKYTAGGLLEEIVDASGEKVVMVYESGVLRSIRVEYRKDGQTRSSTRVYYGYDTLGRLELVKTDLSPDDNSIDDGNFYSTKYTYVGSSNRIATITQKDGNALTLTYQQDPATSNWWVDTMKDGEGRLTRVTRGVNGSDVEDASGHRIRYAYDAAGRLQKVSDLASGESTRYEYDIHGNVIRATNALGVENTFAYDSEGNQVRDYIQGVHDITRTFYKPGLLQTETVIADLTTGDASTARIIYDWHDRPWFKVSPEGRVTEFRYNEKGEQAVMIVYAGDTFDLSGWAAGAVPSPAQMDAWVRGTDKTRSLRTDYFYDSRSLLAAAVTCNAIAGDGMGIADGSQTVLHYVYDQDGLLRQTVDTRGRQVSFGYDGIGRLTSTIDSAQGDATIIRYDDVTRTTVTTGVNGNTVTEVFDRNGQLLSSVQHSSVATGTTTYSYDGAGRPVMVLDAYGTRRFMLYDTANRKVADIDGDGSVTEYRYGRNGLLTHTISYATFIDVTKLVDAGGHPKQASLASIRPATKPSDRHAWNIYDKAGRLQQTVDANGAVVSTLYDGHSRVVAVVRHRAAVDVAQMLGTDTPAAFALAIQPQDSVSRVFYDEDGYRVGNLDAAGGLEEYEYDAAGQMVATIEYTVPTESALRLHGTLAELRSAGGVAASAVKSHVLYNSKGQQVGVVDGLGYLTETSYDTNGSVQRKIHYATKVNWHAGATLDSLRPVASNDDRKWSYTYTLLNQLRTETAPDNSIVSYVYDETGGLVSSTRSSALQILSTAVARYDVEGRLMAEVPADAAWRIAAAGVNAAAIEAVWTNYGVSYQYDATGRRVGMTAPGGARTLYYYDADGRLAHTVNTLGQVQSVYYNAFNQAERSVNYGATVPAATLATMSGGNASALADVLASLAGSAITSRTLYDHNGRVQATIDPLGALTSYAYDAFGNVSEQRAFANAIDPALTEEVIRTGLAAGTFADAVHDQHQRFAYDNAGRLAATFTALQVVEGVQQWSVATRSYDGEGRLAGTTAYVTPLSGTTPSAADLASLPKSIFDQRTRLAYDALGRLSVSASVTSDYNGEVKWTLQQREYDANGLLVVDRILAAPFISSDPSAADLVAGANALRFKGDSVTRYAYDEMGRVTAKAVSLMLVDNTVVNWAVTSMKYDLAGNLLETTEYAAGLSSTTLPEAATNADYAAWMKTAPANVARDRTTRYVYDAGNRLHYTIDAMGEVTGREYDARGNVVQVTAYATAFTGTVGAGFVPATSSGDVVTRTVYDKANRPQYQVDAEGGVTEYRYDALGNLAQTIGYANRITTLTLSPATTPADMQALLAAKLDAANDRSTRNVYDNDGRLRFTVDAQGYVTEKQYNALGQLVKSLAYADYTTLAAADQTLANLSAFGVAELATGYTRFNSYEYDAQGHVSRSTDVDGKSEYFRYDGAGNKIAFINKLGNEWNYQYLASGKMWEELAPPVDVVDNNGVRTTLRLATHFTYHALGMLDKRIEAAGVEGYERVTEYDYDLVGRQVKVWMPKVPVYNSNEILSTAAGIGRSETEPAEVTTIVVYDALGNAIINKDVGDRLTRKVYDKLGRVKFDIDAKGQVTGYEYDALGNRTALTRYAEAPNLTNSDYSEASVAEAVRVMNHAHDRTIRTTYDRNGNAVKVVEPASFVYDVLATDNTAAPGYGTLVKVTLTEYNGFGEARQQRVFGADAANPGNVPEELRMRTIPAETRLYYNQRGERIAQYVLANTEAGAGAGGEHGGYVTTTDYNAFGDVRLVTEFAKLVNENNVNDNGFGSLVQSEQDRKTGYTYDLQGRKASEQHIDTEVGVLNGDSMGTGQITAETRYAYDVLGNLTLTTDAGGGEVRSYYDASGRVTAVTAMGGPGGHVALTTFARDVYGNVVIQTQYAGEATASGLGYTTPLDKHQDDRTTTMQYNRNGNMIAVKDGENHWSYMSYDIYGRVAKQWQQVTTHEVLGLAIANTTYTVMQYDELGQVVKVLTPTDAGSKVQENHYNAFGELTKKLMNGVEYEFAKYDDAGNVWCTNAGDGIAKLMFHNLVGQVTSQVRSSKVDGINLAGFNTVQEAAAAVNASGGDLQKGLVRNDTSYNLIGGAVSQTGTEHAVELGGSSVNAVSGTGVVTASTVHSWEPVYGEIQDGPETFYGVTGYRSTWSGTNTVHVTYQVPADAGSGDYRIEVAYDYSGMEDLDEESQGFGPGTATHSVYLRSDQLTLATGSTDTYTLDMSWGGKPAVEHPEQMHVRIYKKDVSGKWVTLSNASPAQPSQSGPFMAMPLPGDGLGKARMEFTLAGGGVQSIDPALVYNFGDSALIDLHQVPAGINSYRLFYTPLGGDTEVVVDSGVLMVAVNGAGQHTASRILGGSTYTQTVRATSHQKLDRWGNVLEVTDPRNPDWFIRYTYNDSNQVVKQESVVLKHNSDGTVEQTASTLGETFFDGLGREVGSKDGRGNLNRKVYGGDGQVAEEHHADGGIVQYDYNLFGERSAVRTYRNLFEYSETRYAYDHLGHLAEVSTAAITYQNELNNPGNLQVQRAAQDLAKESYGYDELGRRNATTSGIHSSNGANATGATRYVAYDHDGNVVAEINELDNAKRYTYDAFGHKTGSTVEDDGVVHTQVFEVDKYGRLLHRYDTTAGTTCIYTYTYDGLGQLTHQTSSARAEVGAGQELAYVYDGDRLAKIIDSQDPQGQQVTTYAYDLGGNRTRERTVDKAGRVVQDNHIAYDQLGRMTEVADGRFNVKVGYDAASNRTTIDTYYIDANGDVSDLHAVNQFDAMNRETVVEGIQVAGVPGGYTRGANTHILAYDWAGNRTSDAYTAKVKGGQTEETTETYSYDNGGRLSDTYRNGYLVDRRFYDSAGRLLRFGGEVGSNQEQMEHFLMAPEFRINQYDAAGQLIRQKVRDVHNNFNDDIYFRALTDRSYEENLHAGYSSAGSLRGYYVVPKDNGPQTQFQNDYIWFDGAKTSEVRAYNNGGMTRTVTKYDANGYVATVTDFDKDGHQKVQREYANDASGQVLWKKEGDLETNTLIVNGQVLGSINTKMDDRGFANTYDGVTGSGMSSSPSAYVVRSSGETPGSIAQQVWGDSKLWYLIADANALAGNDVLSVGKALHIPARVNTVHSDSTTFKPYDAADAVGSTSPVMPTPIINQKQCGVVGKIVAAIVIAVATFYGQEWAAEIASELAFAGAAAGAAVGNAVVQRASMAMGYQEHFNGRQVAMSALGAAVSVGMFGPAKGLSPFQLGVRAAMSNAVTQGIAVAVHLQEKFDWRNVVAAGAGGWAGGELGLKLKVGESTGLDRLFRSTVVGIGAGATTAALGGGKFSWTQVTADAFGNALAERVLPSDSPQRAPRAVGVLAGLSNVGTYGTMYANAIENGVAYDFATVDELRELARIEEQNGGVLPKSMREGESLPENVQKMLDARNISLNDDQIRYLNKRSDKLKDLISELSSDSKVTLNQYAAAQSVLADINQLGLKPLAKAGDPHVYYLNVVIDGTNNNKDDILFKTNPGIFADDLFVRNSNSFVIYEPGVGTGEEGVRGSAFGAGAKERINDALRRVSESMGAIYANDSEAQIIITVTGFSRGAFMSRDFVNIVNDGVPIAGSYDESGHAIRYSGARSPRVGAMILYDTVGSMGIAGNDINVGFRSDIPANVEHVLHVTSNDDWRLFFPLSSITKNTSSDFFNDGRLVQAGIPGVHSDVGGSYAGKYSYFSLNMGHSFAEQLGMPVRPLTTQGYDYNVNNYSIDSMQLHDSSWGIDRLLHGIGLESKKRVVYPAGN